MPGQTIGRFTNQVGSQHQKGNGIAAVNIGPHDSDYGEAINPARTFALVPL